MGKGEGAPGVVDEGGLVSALGVTEVEFPVVVEIGGVLIGVEGVVVGDGVGGLRAADGGEGGKSEEGGDVAADHA